MRAAAAVLLCGFAASAQFRSTVPLVVAPTTITDPQGKYVDGLRPSDLILYDNNVPQPIQMDWMLYPISLVVVVQASSNSRAVLDKLGGSGVLFTDLLAAYAGETALVTFADEAQVRLPFTTDSRALTGSLQKMRVEGDGACILDGIREALRLLDTRAPGRRRVILVIGERRDRSSQAGLTDVMREVERQNTAIYWLTFKPFLQPFTAKSKNPDSFVLDSKKKGKTDAEWQAEKKEEDQHDYDRTLPGPGGIIYALGELTRLKKPDLADLFTRVTGARSIGFLQKKGLEQAVQAVSEEVHRQYILTFQPHAGDAGQFHAIRVTVKDRPDLHIKTREGYWPVE